MPISKPVRRRCSRCNRKEMCMQGDNIDVLSFMPYVCSECRKKDKAGKQDLLSVLKRPW